MRYRLYGRPCVLVIVILDLGFEMFKNGKGTVTPTDSGMEGDLSPHHRGGTRVQWGDLRVIHNKVYNKWSK